MGIKKLLLVMVLAVMIGSGLVMAIEQKNFFDINMMENDIYNITYLNATYMFQDGVQLYTYLNPYGFYNDSDFSITDYFTKAQIDGFSFYNSSDFSISDYFTKSQVEGFDYWNDTYATFNETYGDTLYAPIGEPLWTGNQSNYFTKTQIDSYEFWNSTLAYFNETYADTLYAQINEPLWTGNQSSYFTKSQIDGFSFYNSSDFSISDYFTKTQVDGFGFYNSTDFVITDYFTKAQIDGFSFYNSTDFDIADYASVSEPLWTGNQSSYYLKTEIDTQGEVESIWSVSLATDTELAAQDACSEITGCVENALTAEVDTFWTGNYTACAAGNHLYFSSGNLACEADQQGGGGTGAPHWVDNGTFLSPNASYATNIEVQGYIMSSNWTDVSITESQISDFGSYYPYSNPYGYYNDTVIPSSPSGELGGTWASPTVDSGIHDDEYIELGDSFGGDVSGTYDSISLDCSDVVGDGLDCDGETIVIAPGDFAGSGLNAFDSNLELGSMTKNWDGGAFNITAEQFFADAWTDVSITESQVSDADWWDANADIDDDEITEAKIAFSTECAAGEYYRLSGNDLECTAPSGSGGWTQTATSDLNMSDYDILNASSVRLGHSEGDSFIYFYEDGSATGESIKWDDGNDRFEFSDHIYTVTLESGGTMATDGLISSEVIYTTGSGDDLWLGSSTQANANFRAYATGEIHVDADSIPITFGEGQDADIYYDGTDLDINPQVVGSGDTTFVAGAVNITAGNVYVENNYKVCLNSGCTRYLWDNGTNAQIVG